VVGRRIPRRAGDLLDELDELGLRRRARGVGRRAVELDVVVVVAAALDSAKNPILAFAGIAVDARPAAVNVVPSSE
jgi:hypothetical protein